MFNASAEYYDLIYSAFKDYASEVAQIASLLRRLNPQCRTVLDVGCGTGEHARLLAAEGFEVDGLDLDPAFVRIAAGKHRAGRFFEADMSDFRVPHRYDAVVCLFSSIGYLRTLDRVRRALICFREHLAAGGAVVVEPWLSPGVLDPDRRDTHTGEARGVRVSRSARVEVEEDLSRLLFDYEIDEDGVVHRLSEVHELGLFTTGEQTLAFREAGLDVQHDPVGITGRGLFIATRIAQE
jgi:SAM-dependent methyltransferase